MFLLTLADSTMSMRNTRASCAASMNSPSFSMDYNPLAAEVSEEHAG